MIMMEEKCFGQGLVENSLLAHTCMDVSSVREREKTRGKSLAEQNAFKPRQVSQASQVSQRLRAKRGPKYPNTVDRNTLSDFYFH